MALEWHHAAHVRAAPDAVYAWMTDFRPDDHDSEAFRRAAGVKPGAKPALRKVLAREGNVVRLEDQWAGRTFRHTVHLQPQQRQLRIEGEYGYEAVWRAVPEKDGTRVECQGRMAPTGLFKLLLPLFAKGMQKQTAEDFRGHVADLEAGLAKGR